MTGTVNRLLRRSSRAVLAMFGVLAMVLLAAPPASAHTELVESDPPDGASLNRVPVAAQLVFSDAIAGDFATVVVTPGAGAAPQPAPAAVDGAGVTVDLSQVPAAPPAGQQPWTWQLSYRVVSEDGHPIEGAIAFSVSTSVPPTAPIVPSTTIAATTPTVSVPSSATAPATTSSANNSTAPVAAVDAAAPQRPAGDLVWAYLLAGSVVLAVGVLLTAALARRRRSDSLP